MIQAILVLAVLLILVVLNQTPLVIFFIMGIVCVLIVRNGIKNYEDSKKKVSKLKIRG